MKLAAIDIGTNSIHMIIAEAISKSNFEIIEREKEMAKLGAGVFASNYISDSAFQVGLETIDRYVQLADRLGVDEIITAATSAIREAHNGENFLNEVAAQTGLCPRIISGQEEARLILLAVRNSIALEEDKALVLDIGGGSTEAVIGDRSQIFFRDSMPLGVLRLLDMFEDKGAVGIEGRGVLEAHIRFIAQQIFEQIHPIGFDRLIGTSGTIRTMGEAAHIAAGGESWQSVNAEVVQLKDISTLTQKLLEMKLEERANVDEVSDKRADAIHLGGVLLVQLMEMAGVPEITLCDASLREGMILDYLKRHSPELADFPEPKNLRYRKAAYLAYKYESDWKENCHVANLAIQIFDQTQKLHEYGDFEREILEFAALLHDIGQFISFRKHHKNSRHIIKRTDPRGFTDEEILLIRQLVRYHCKAKPTKKHKKFKKLSKQDRRLIKMLSGILRIAVALNKTKNRRVKSIACQISEEKLEISVSGADNLEVEIWAARRSRQVFAEVLKRQVKIHKMLASELKTELELEQFSI
ncbi:Phosphatase [Hyella patelloides LEGE 07179]|uniref:Phosphatase n=1 Tax=Hyella patelloides LEGE 07179 TaxID=945734 RepID=A0A563VMY0_9CYAN|nr:Ppx/GppA phosphatase family protein [Hyella patelloides]VEP12810.1 Phosphatase [Hyella patelloides LEGE 07179]